MNRLFQELCADVRPPVGSIGTSCGDMVWGIRYLIQEFSGQDVIWHRPGDLLITDRMGPTQPATPDGIMQEFDCISLVSVHGKATDSAIYDSHNIEPIPYSVQGITQKEES
jgi:hypothetical protein